MSTNLTLPTPPRFDLHRAVCSYGYFILEPNRWDIQRRVLRRPLRTAAGRVVNVVIRQRSDRKLAIACDREVGRDDHQVIKDQIRRMFRYDEDLAPWRKLHPVARRRGFARMFRSPSLFEDMVKTITSCNVTWRNTRNMNRLLVEHVGHGGFPTPEQLADVGEERLRARCRVGYRADRMIRLARSVADGDLDLDWFESKDRTSDERYDAFLKIHGLGPYAAGNLCHLVGSYDRLAIDTETYRHYCHVHNVKRPKNPAKLHPKIDRYYGQFAPYQFLAYWFELWEDYQTRFGPAWRWDDSTHENFTAATLK